MAYFAVPDVASLGLVTDIDPVLLPPAAWTETRNARFYDQSAAKFLGQTSVATPSVPARYILPVIKGTTAYWVYCGLDKVYSWDGTTHTNITPNDGGAPPVDTDFTGNEYDLWNGAVIQGVAVLNNGVDAPQMWVGTTLAPLQWDGANTWADKGYTAKVIRPYKDYLVALRWNDGAEEYPLSVYWSNAADPLSVPSDWDYADPANEAGIATLAATPGYIVDGEQLRDAFAIYKEDSIFLMQYVGGAFVMSFRDVSKTTGVLTQRCAKEVYGRHVVLCSDDIIVHDGQTIESIADKRVKRRIFSSIDPTAYSKSFVARNLGRQEVWICFPETGSTVPNMAAVWHWRDNTWSFRELPAMHHIAYGVLPSGTDDDTWDGDSGTWDTDTLAWGERSYNPAAQTLVGVADADLLFVDNGTTFDGTDINAYVLREGLLLDGQPTVKMVKAIYPRANGAALSVSIGHKWAVTDPYVWEGPYTFDPATQSVLRVRSTGRFHALKFAFPTAGDSRLNGYDLEYEVVAAR